MKIISPILKHALYPVLARTRALAERAGVAVLTYHGVLPRGYRGMDPVLDGALISADSLRRQLDVLRRRYHVITPGEFRDSLRNGNVLPEKSVLLTCDDGLLNTATDMLPVLNEYEVKCLFFVTGASAGNVPSILWDEELFLLLQFAPDITVLPLEDMGFVLDGSRRIGLWKKVTERLARQGTGRRELLDQLRGQLGFSESWLGEVFKNESLRRRFQLLSLDGLRTLTIAGMSIGAHTMTHPVLPRLSDQEAEVEISTSRSKLGMVLKDRPWAFAYPFGGPDSVSKREMQLAQAAGFECAFVNVDGGFGAEMPLYAIPRVHVTGSMSIAELEVHISGTYRNLRRNLQGATWQAAATI